MKWGTGVTCVALAMLCTAASCRPEGELVGISMQWDDHSPADTGHYEVRVNRGATQKVAADPKVTAPTTTVRVPPDRLFQFEVRSCRQDACSPWTSQELMAPAGKGAPE